MPRIAEKNARFRSKKEICHDLSIVLNSQLSYGTKYAVLAEITWVWSEYAGKYKGCKYWSVKAKESYLVDKGLIHEHIVPKRILIDKLLNEIPYNQQEIFNFLDVFCIGVVVTKDEDRALNNAGLKHKMPDSWDHKDPWARYKKVDINVQKVET
jgi:hypothetical protein